MIRVSITQAAFEAIADTLPFGSTMYEAEPSSEGEGGVFVWLERRAVDQLHALRQRGEKLSDVILILAEIEMSRPGPRRGRPSPQR